MKKCRFHTRIRSKSSFRGRRDYPCYKILATPLNVYVLMMMFNDVRRYNNKTVRLLSEYFLHRLPENQTGSAPMVLAHLPENRHYKILGEGWPQPPFSPPPPPPHHHHHHVQGFLQNANELHFKRFYR